MKKISTFFGLCFCMLAGNISAQEQLPFSETFDSEDSMSRFVIVDANNDGITWKYDAEQKLARYDYNDYKAGDDWMFTPVFELKKDTRYKVTFDTKCKSISYSERIQITLGDSANPESHTAISEPIEVMWNSEFRTTEIEFTSPVSGEMCVGFHEISDAGMYYLLLDNIKIQSFDASVVAPGIAATECNIVPGAEGRLTAHVSFNAPSTDADGNALSQLDRIDVYRNDTGAAVYTFESPVPGAPCSFDDTVPSSGEYTYTIVSSNQGGESEPLTQSVYIGYDVPAAVGNLRFGADGYDVKLSWDAPQHGLHDGYIGTLTYTVVDLNGNVLAQGLENTGFDYTVSFDSDLQQDLVDYTVYAVNGVVEGEKDSTGRFATGLPYTAPIDESFFMGKITYYPWYSDKTGTGEEDYWNIRTYGYSPHADAQDEDAGMMTFRSMVAPAGTEERFYSPIFSMGDLVNPALSFYIYHTDDGSKDQLAVEVSANGSDFVQEGIYQLDCGTAEGWGMHVIPLGKYAGCDSLVIAFKGISAEGSNIHMDNISIYDDCTDLSVAGISTESTSVDPNMDFTIKALIQNQGTGNVDNFKLNLYRNDVLVQTADALSLVAGMELTIPFNVKETVTSVNEDIYYSVEIVSDVDQVAKNNRSENLYVDVVKPRFPVVTGLTGRMDDGKVVLEWSAADKYKNHAVITDDFESYETFIIDNIGNWKTYDADGAESGFFDKADYYENRGLPMAYQVFDPVKAGLDMDVYQYTWGNMDGSSQYLLSIYNLGDLVANDDWLISPEVADDKMISFYAKSVTSGYKLETIEVLYSDKSDDPADFELLDELTLPDKWMNYSYRLPEGSKYFAIRHTTHGGLGLLLDNISYAPVTDTPEEEEAKGYLVYRDGQLITSEPVTSTRFVDDVEKAGTYQYQVTAVFPSGESYLSDAVEVNTLSGVADVAGDDVRVFVEAGELVVQSGLTGEVVVYDMTGRTVAVMDKNDYTSRIHIGNGAYLVSFAGKVFKILN